MRFAATGRLSFRTQVLLVFLLCLALVGIGMVFLNTYVIAGLKENMRRQAFFLAEDLGRKASDQIQDLVDKNAQGDLLTLQSDPRLARQLEVTFRANKTVLAACVVNTRGEVVRADFGQNPAIRKVLLSKQGMEAEIAPDPGNFTNITVRLREIDPAFKTRPMEIPIVKGKDLVGRLRLLISESDIYRDIEAASREITRRLWSVLLAFVGVLALALYLMARLFRRQLHLVEENEGLDRMAYVGTLASGLAHEIRNPLNAMSVNLSVAEEEIAVGDAKALDTTRRILDLLRREIGRLNHAVTGFMEFAHPSVGRRERTPLRPLVEEVLELLRPRIEECGATVEVLVPADAELLADFSGLRQVLYNVILNALQAMAANAEGRERCLTIGGRRESAQWLLWIEDTGPGVPPGEEEKIFEVFHSTKAAGTGLGLSIARAIIVSHDGDIHVARREGGGLRVEVILPEIGQNAWRRSA